MLYAFDYIIILDYNKFPINTTFVAYLLENANLGLSRGVAFAHFFKAPSRGFCMKKKKTKKRNNCPTNARGEATLGIDWAIRFWYEYLIIDPKNYLDLQETSLTGFFSGFRTNIANNWKCINWVTYRASSGIFRLKHMEASKSNMAKHNTIEFPFPSLTRLPTTKPFHYILKYFVLFGGSLLIPSAPVS